MFTFSCDSYLICLRFIDSDKKYIGENSNIVKKFDKDDFGFISMDVIFDMNKIPDVIIYAKPKSITKLSEIRDIIISVTSINDGSRAEKDMLNVAFPATVVNCVNNAERGAVLHCKMEYNDLLYGRRSVNIQPTGSLLLTKEPESIAIGKLIDSLSRNYKMHHKPSGAVLKAKTLVDRVYQNMTPCEMIESLGPMLGEGMYFDFKEIKMLGESLLKSGNKGKSLPLISINKDTKILHKRSTQDKSYADIKINVHNNFDIATTNKYVATNKSFSIPFKSDNTSVYKYFENSRLSPYPLQFEYQSSSPNYISIGDPVIVFTSLDGNMIPGFVIKEKLTFSDKIIGSYVIGADPATSKEIAVVQN